MNSKNGISLLQGSLPVSSKWSKPNVGWVKCNFDGAWIQNGLRGGFGVML